MSKLLKEATEKKEKFYLQFGGQGAPWFKELQKYYPEAGFRKFFDTVIQAVEKTVEKTKGTKALPQGLNLRGWLDNPDSLPSEDYLAIAPVSMPMIEITQFAHYEALHQAGFDRQEMLKLSAGTTGHSQGLIAASFAALNKQGEEYYAALGLYVEYLFLMGIRAQEVYTEIFATDAQNQKAEAAGVKGIAPMIAVLGDSHATIEKMVADFNPTLPAEKKIYVSLYNSPNNRIISSYRDSLIAFYEKNKADLEAKGIKFVPLRTSCPFHCELMNPIKDIFAKDVKEIGFHFTGKDLQVPLYSFSDGRNMQQDAELGVTMCVELMINTLHWDQSMKAAAASAEIKTIIDFGPGKTSQRLSQDTLAGLGSEKNILAVAFAKDFKTLTEA